jgi:hypothetical protein
MRLPRAQGATTCVTIAAASTASARPQGALKQLAEGRLLRQASVALAVSVFIAGARRTAQGDMSARRDWSDVADGL